MQNFDKNFVGKVFAWLLSIFMVVGIVPVGIFAQEVFETNLDVSRPLIEDNVSEPGGINTGTTIIKKVDGNNKKYLFDTTDEKEYYLKPNWEEESVEGKGLAKWSLESGQSLGAVNNMSEPIETAQLNYDGYHETPDGDTVIDMIYSFRMRARSSAWSKISLFVSEDLNKSIDWTKSYFLGKSGNLQPYQEKKFNNGSKSNIKNMSIVDMQQTGTIAGMAQHVPIRLYLKGVKRKDLDKIDTTIQSRITDEKGKQIYTKNIGNTKNSNMLISGYASYTSAAAIPKTNETDLSYGTMPYLQVVRGVDQAPQFFSSQNNVSYDPSKSTLYIATQFSKGDSDASDDNMNGNRIAYRLAFSSELVSSLKEDDNGFVGYVEPSKTTGAKASENPSGDRTGFTKQQINVVGDMAYVIYAPSNFKTNDETGQIIYPSVGTKGFIGNTSTDLSDQQFTLTTFNVDSEKLKKLYPTIDNSKPAMTNIDVNTSMIVQNSYGMDKVTFKTTEDMSVRKGGTLIVKFDKPLYSSENDIKMSFLNNKETASKIAVKLGEYPFIGNLGIYPAAAGTRGVYDRYDFDLNNNRLEYKYQFKEDFKLPAGSDISIFSGAGGRMTGNSGSIIVGGKEVARFGETAAKTSYAPRMLLGTKVSSSAILDRTQYMPSINEVFEDSQSISGYTIIPDQALELHYLNANIDRRFLNSVSSSTQTENAKYSYDKNNFPTEKQKLYQYNISLERNKNSVKLIKDSPITVRSYNYIKAVDVKQDSDDSSIRTALGSDQIITGVQTVVTFDLNQGKLPSKTSEVTGEKATLSFEGMKDPANIFDYKTERANDTAAVKRIVPFNKNLSIDKAYVANGFENKEGTEDQRLLTSDGKLAYFDERELTGDALELRKMPDEPKIEGKSFVGWSTKRITTEEELKQFNEAKTVEKATDWAEVDKGTIYKFDKYSPVVDARTVYAVYDESFIIRLHRNAPSTAMAQNILDSNEKTEEVYDLRVTLADIKNGNNIKIPYAYDNDKMELPDTFKIEGHTFVGWKVNKDDDKINLNSRNSKWAIVTVEKDPDFLDNTKVASRGKRFKDGFNIHMNPDTFSDKYVGKILDLYAIYTPYIDISAKKVYKGIDAKTSPTVAVGLLYRKAVTDYNYPTIADEAAYYVPENAKEIDEKAYRDINFSQEGSPKEAIVKIYNNQFPDSLRWNVRGFDDAGDRLSYILVEMENPNNAPTAGSSLKKYYEFNQQWSSLGIIVHPGARAEQSGKTQVFTTRENGSTKLDAFSAATVRSSKHLDENDKVNSPVVKYNFTLTNTKVVIVDPILENITEGETGFKLVQTVNDKVQYIRIKTTIDGSEKIYIFEKEPSEMVWDLKFVDGNAPTSIDTLKANYNTRTKELVFSGHPAFKRGNKVEATYIYGPYIDDTKNSTWSNPALKIVKKMENAGPAKDLKQMPNIKSIGSEEDFDKDYDTAVITAIRPTEGIEAPKSGTTYTLVDADTGREIKKIDMDPSTENLRFEVKKADLGGTTNVKIISREPGKLDVKSSALALDLDAPELSNAKIKDSGNRLFLDFEATIDGTQKEEGVTIVFDGKPYRGRVVNNKVILENQIPRPIDTDKNKPKFDVYALDKYNNQTKLLVVDYKPMYYAGEFKVDEPFEYDDFVKIYGADGDKFKVEVKRNGQDLFTAIVFTMSKGSNVVEFGEGNNLEMGDEVIITNLGKEGENVLPNVYETVVY